MKKIPLLFVFLALPFLVSADTNDICRNSNILAYSPPQQTSIDGNKYLVFYTTSDIKISSLEASFNGDYRQVQYKQFGNIIRAKVLIPETMCGNIITTIGAQSVGGCNTPITFLFTKPLNN